MCCEREERSESFIYSVAATCQKKIKMSEKPLKVSLVPEGVAAPVADTNLEDMDFNKMLDDVAVEVGEIDISAEDGAVNGGREEETEKAA